MTEREHEPWHLDKRVPLALILALLVQTAGMVWWAATLSSRVDGHAADIARLVESNSGHAAERQRVAETLARLDERMAAQSMIYKSAAQYTGYVNSTISQWAEEASAFIAWHDQVRVAVYKLDPKNPPTIIQAALALLPVFQRP